ncbi:MAG: ribosomal protein S18-alanine N-acetyltransferase [Burkholderiaceae bacterium]|nr:ribosomal protein S18-alanine N-acetyltransferase [Burkholderiaceae bacterium]
MRVEDLDRVMGIERLIYPFPWSRGNFDDSLAAGYDAWIFAAGPRILGYAVLMWSLDEVHLLNLSVDANEQGRGLGRRILEVLCADIRQRGGRAVLLEVRPTNEVALRLYRAASFETIGLRRGYYPDSGGKREDAIVMRRVLEHG